MFMKQTIKIINSYIKESEAVLNKNIDFLIKEQIIKIKNELGIKVNLDDRYLINTMWYEHPLKHKDRLILISLIKRMKNYRARLLDRLYMALLCPIIGIFGVMVGAILTFILNKFSS